VPTLTPMDLEDVIMQLVSGRSTAMDLIFVLRIPLFFVVVALLIFALPAGLIVGAALVAYLLWRWSNRRTRIAQDRRAATIGPTGKAGTRRQARSHVPSRSVS
jgi:hypothetical protein